MGKTKKLVSLALSVAMLLGSVATFGQVPSVQEVIERPEDLQRKIVGYFPEWAYTSEEHNYFNATDLQWDYLTHIQYSFAFVDPVTNKITLNDRYAAVEETFEGMDLSYEGQPIALDPNLSYKGHFNVLQQMKKQFPEVELLISVGGWAGSRGFYTMMDTDQGIQTFVNSCVDFIRKYGFDGVDIDFEFPSSTSQSGNPDDFDVSEPRRSTINARYNVMMERLREALDKAGKEDGTYYTLSAAVSASSWVLGGVDSNAYAEHLDFLSIMSYDYHGGWNQFVENQANIYPDPADTETKGMIMPVLGMDWSYNYYRGVLPPEKILMGIPYYTRGWENVQGGDGTGLHGSSKTPATGKYNLWGDPDPNKVDDKIPAGANPLWHALNLMEQDPNLNEYWDNVGKVPHLWQSTERVFLSFENERSIDERLKYIDEKNLGGALIWVMDGDYGLNPNYVPGSTDINEGKYTYGDTLTKRLRQGMDAMGPAEKTEEGLTGLEEIAVDVDVKGNYDHPNYTYEFIITNHTEETLKGGWEISFDLPKSAVFKSSWGGTVKEKDNGDFTRITLTSSGWQNLEPGASTNLQGMIGLCFSGLRNLTFNGMIPAGEHASVNVAPQLRGVDDTTILVGDAFDVMAGVEAYDKEDGDLTDVIQVTGTVDTEVEGIYELTYTVADQEGLQTTATRNITVALPAVSINTVPQLKGVDDRNLTTGDAFDAMAGVEAYDKEDGDLTGAIQVEGAVDTAVIGVYVLTYTVSDSQDAKARAVRTVTVEEKVVEPNEAPLISGVKDHTLKVGDGFDAMAGVEAYDKEDGDLTAAIQVESDVDTTKEGIYTATYTVTDSEGLQAIEISTVTVESIAIDPNPEDTYDPARIYNTGDKVIYKGDTYTAKWWVQGQAPDTSDAWEKAPEVGEDGYETYMPGKAYVGGDIVRYNGELYKAKWWTTAEPGTNEEWEKI